MPHDDPAEIAEMLGICRHRAANLVKRLPKRKTSQAPPLVSVPPSLPAVACDFDDEIDTELADEPLMEGETDGKLQRPKWEELDD
jgi:hypothetical protein